MRALNRVAAATVIAIGASLAPSLSWARAGDGGSFGSRGSYTYTPPAATRTAPYSAQPMQRSYTPAPSYAAPSYGQPAYGSGNRSPFVSGLLGGLIGAGLGGLLFGHGLFGGISGIGGFLGLLLQVFLLVMLGRWLFGLLARRPAFAGMGAFARTGAAASGGFGGGGAPVTAITLRPQDFQAFEVVLKNIQAAWSAHDMNALRRMATPEMASYFAEQIADQTSRGVRNAVTDVRLEQGDLAEAWHENGRDYATVAMRFSMLDATRDAVGRVVEGSLTVRSLATELWTFIRAPGGIWLLSAIQQAR